MKDLQHLIHNTRKQRGFTMEPLKIFTLLNEEIGEVATELKKNWSPNYEDSSIEKMAEEIADVQVCLIALANQFDIDIEAAVRDKFLKYDADREWKTAQK